MADLDTRAVGAGIPIGAGLGATVALLVDGNVALGAGYGAAGGILIGTLIARVAPPTTSMARPWLGLTALALVIGALVGGGLGAVAAWGGDGALIDGALLGGGAGLALAILLAAVVGFDTHNTGS